MFRLFTSLTLFTSERSAPYARVPRLVVRFHEQSRGRRREGAFISEDRRAVQVRANMRPIPRRIKKQPSCTEPAMTHLAKRRTISDKNAELRILPQPGAQVRGFYIIRDSCLGIATLLPQLLAESALWQPVGYFA